MTERTTQPRAHAVWRGPRTAAVALVVAVLAVGSGLWWWYQRPEQRFARALAAVDGKRFDQVGQELARLERAADDSPHSHFLRGVLLLQDGRCFPALDEFGRAVDDPELHQRTLIFSGLALYRVQNLPAAIRLLNEAVQTDPTAVEAHRCLAAAYYDLGLNEDAMRHLVQVTELDLTDPRPLRLMGLIQKDFENYAGAIESYRGSLSRSGPQPDREAVLQELAECQLKLRQYDEALTTLADSLPGPERWALEAEGHYGAGRPDEARRLLAQTLQAAPANLRALLLQGTITLEAGDAATAVKVLSQAAAAYPKDYTVRYKLERAWRRVGDNAQADEHARVAAELKRLREEFSKLHETAATEPNNADVRCQLGILARQLDRPDLARVWFQAALVLDPQHAETLRQISVRPSSK